MNLKKATLLGAFLLVTLNHVAADTLYKTAITDAFALYNDGIQAVMYLDSPTQPSNDWIIHLEGGGSCEDPASCIARQISEPQKMRANTNPTINKQGIFNRLGTNQFGSFNHVYLGYCSSDRWIGDSSPASNGTVWQFRGRKILDSAINDLSAGATYTKGSGKTVTLPSLDDAARVIFSGSSAGGAGVILNADRISGVINPSESFHAVVDGTYNLTSEQILNSRYDAHQANYATATFRGLYDGIYDSSCENTWTGTGERFRCSDPAFIIRNHLSTPVFARSTLDDVVIRNAVNNLGLLTTPLTRIGHVALTHAEFVKLGTWPWTAEETMNGTPLPQPGAFAPACGDHVGLLKNPEFFNHEVDNAGGTPITFHDNLHDWIYTTPQLINLVIDGFPTTPPTTNPFPC